MASALYVVQVLNSVAVGFIFELDEVLYPQLVVRINPALLT